MGGEESPRAVRRAIATGARRVVAYVGDPARDGRGLTDPLPTPSTGHEIRGCCRSSPRCRSSLLPMRPRLRIGGRAKGRRSRAHGSPSADSRAANTSSSALARGSPASSPRSRRSSTGRPHSATGGHCRRCSCGRRAERMRASIPATTHWRRAWLRRLCRTCMRIAERSPRRSRSSPSARASIMPDSGLMHFAAASPGGVVGLFADPQASGATDRWGPVGPRARYLQARKAVAEIGDDAVLDALERLVADSPRSIDRVRGTRAPREAALASAVDSALRATRPMRCRSLFRASPVGRIVHPHVRDRRIRQQQDFASEALAAMTGASRIAAPTPTAFFATGPRASRASAAFGHRHRRQPRSRCQRRRRRRRSCSMARSTTIRELRDGACAGRVGISHRRRHGSPAGRAGTQWGRGMSTDCAACSRSRSGTRAGARCSPRAITSASSRSTTRGTASRSCSGRKSRPCSRIRPSRRTVDLTALRLYLECQFIPAPHRSSPACASCRPATRCALARGELDIAAFWRPDYARQVRARRPEAPKRSTVSCAVRSRHAGRRRAARRVRERRRRFRADRRDDDRRSRRPDRHVQHRLRRRRRVSEHREAAARRGAISAAVITR